MESLTLFLFVVGLLIAAFIVTQTIRRELKTREHLRSELRRESMHARLAAPAHNLHAPHAPDLRRRTHKSPLDSV